MASTTVTVRRIGGSAAVIIPRDVARQLDLTEGALLDITSGDESIVLRRRYGANKRRRRPIERLVSQIKPSAYRRRRAELGDDRAVGRETW